MKYFIVLCITLLSLKAELEYAEPVPSMDKPRKVLFSIVDGNPRAIHHVLSSANNILKGYGPENIEMKIVVYYDGIKALLKKNREFTVRVDALMQYNIEFVACRNTMQTKKIDQSELMDDVSVVQAGIMEIIERSQDGWIYIKP